MIWRFSKSSFKKYSPTFRWINLSFQKTVPKFDLNLTEGFGLSKSFRSVKKLSIKWASYLYMDRIFQHLPDQRNISCWFPDWIVRIKSLVGLSRHFARLESFLRIPSFTSKIFFSATSFSLLMSNQSS